MGPSVKLLCCSHEEADTRILFHAGHAVECGADTVVINSQDTDVAVPAISVSHEIPAQLIFHTGTKLESRYVDITSLGRTLGSNIYEAIVGHHAFSECDKTSAFLGRGKADGSKLLKNNDTFQGIMSDIGSSFDASDDIMTACEAAICMLYGKPQHKMFYDLISLDPRVQILPNSHPARMMHVTIYGVLITKQSYGEDV